MEDHIFREKITHFDNKRIPKRVSGTHGYFESYNNRDELTNANF